MCYLSSLRRTEGSTGNLVPLLTTHGTETCDFNTDLRARMALDVLLPSAAMPTLMLSAPLEPVALEPDKANAVNIQHTVPQMGRTHHGAEQAFGFQAFRHHLYPTSCRTT